jgi:hypothetical protein
MWKKATSPDITPTSQTRHARDGENEDKTISNRNVDGSGRRIWVSLHAILAQKERKKLSKKGTLGHTVVLDRSKKIAVRVSSIEQKRFCFD